MLFLRTFIRFSLILINFFPDGAFMISCVGEYNMRLGVLKELRPKLVATFTEKPGSCEGKRNAIARLAIETSLLKLL